MNDIAGRTYVVLAKASSAAGKEFLSIEVAAISGVRGSWKSLIVCYTNGVPKPLEPLLTVACLGAFKVSGVCWLLIVSSIVVLWGVCHNLKMFQSIKKFHKKDDDDLFPANRCQLLRSKTSFQAFPPLLGSPVPPSKIFFPQDIRK